MMRIVIRGVVQGVGFRPAVYRTAASLGLRGTVCNHGSHVTVDVDDGDAFLDSFMKNLPPLARVDSVEKEDYDVPADVKEFSIVGSASGNREGLSIPTDTAICARCIDDMRSGRRTGYPFTTCTDCGPRFTLLRSLPYDRERTAMSEFPRCPVCGKEYSEPSDRRFHHQTVCCPDCGPQYRLVDSGGNPVAGDPITTFARFLEEGKLGIAKSWGGMHICCTLEQTGRLREWYRRGEKPFAIMVRDMDAVRRYAEPTPEEEERLLSPHRPIVLVKKVPSDLTDAVSPGLDNIGIFLPYTGMQILLFDALNADALIMTSANVPGEPMVLDDDRILDLGADVYLLHNQEIVNRADDSVLRVCGSDTFFIRKSRGSLPSYYSVPWRGDAVAVGPQENITGAVASGGRIYPTQHIGNGEHIGVPEYLEEAVRFQMSLLGCRPGIVAEDMHPAYLNRRFAHALAEECGAEIIDVQHHHAHVASLMVDRGNLEHMTALSVDGTGHGDDRAAWGGEVMSCDYSDYERLAHLEYIPLLGGQKALYDIRRLRFAVDTMNGIESETGFNDMETSVLTKMMNTAPRTSSFGRVLDCISYSLGVCSRRTYDGEPAMKLEPLLARGKLVDGFSTCTENGEIRTAHLFERLDECTSKADAAYSMVYGILSEMVASACSKADSDGEGYIGITGGVSYNVPIVNMARGIASKHGKELLVHTCVPNGDAGISTGQIAIALRHL